MTSLVTLASWQHKHPPPPPPPPPPPLVVSNNLPFICIVSWATWRIRLWQRRGRPLRPRPYLSLAAATASRRVSVSALQPVLSHFYPFPLNLFPFPSPSTVPRCRVQHTPFHFLSSRRLNSHTTDCIYFVKLGLYPLTFFPFFPHMLEFLYIYIYIIIYSPLYVLTPWVTFVKVSVKMVCFWVFLNKAFCLFGF